MQGFFDGGRGGSQEAPNGEPSFFACTTRRLGPRQVSTMECGPISSRRHGGRLLCNDDQTKRWHNDGRTVLGLARLCTGASSGCSCQRGSPCMRRAETACMCVTQRSELAELARTREEGDGEWCW